MKIVKFIAVVVGISLFLAGCAPSLATQIDLSISMSPSNIVVNMGNSLQQKATITWEINNRSKITTDQSRYELSIGYARKGAFSTEVIAKLDETFAAGATKKGTYEHTFGAREGMDGDYELHFTLMEKNPDGSFSILKEATPFPFTLKWEK